MKKNILLLVATLFSASLFAQSPFVVSPTEVDGSEVMLMGEAMSQNTAYVAGADQSLQVPIIWNTQTGEVMMIAENDSIYVDWEDEPYWMPVIKTGAFHAVNNAGIAVGSLTAADYVSHPIMARADGQGQYAFLHENEGNAGCEAYGITDDGSTIVGFYFDENWVTRPCIWTNQGATLTDLPTPTEAEMGFPIDYASARWVSADGSLILGYAQDANTGGWVAMTWKLQGGQYVVQPIANDYYQTRYYEGDSLVVPGQNPYYEFQPEAISADGQWVSLGVVEAYDMNDFSYFPPTKAARLNLATGLLEVLEVDADYQIIEMFGIADDGTCVGRYTGALDPVTWMQEVAAVYWKAGSSDMQKLSDLFPNDDYVAGMAASDFGSITADGAYAMGCSYNAEAVQTAFYVRLAEPQVGIAQPDVRVSLYPCPAADQLTVTLNGEIASLTVVNVMGQVVYAQDAIHSNEATIDVQTLPEGLYLVNITTGDTRITRRITIVR